MFTRFVFEFGKMSQIVIEIYYNTTKGGGLPDLLQYYKGEGGVSRDPKFVLRNIWTAP